MMMPPMMLMKTTRSPATAEEAAFVFQRLAALARDLLVDQAGREVGVDRHLLARHGVEVKARRDFRDAARALGDDDEVHGDEDREYDDPDHEIAAHNEAAERFDDVAGGIRPLMAAGQYQPRRGEVERKPQHGRDQKNGRKRREFERRLDEQRGHQDQDGQRDRDREKQIEHQRGQGQDQHDQNGENTEGKRDVAALDEAADVAEFREVCGGARALTRRGVDHVTCVPPRMPSTGPKRLRGG